MNRKLTPIVMQTFDHFRRHGTLPNGEKQPLNPQQASQVSDAIRDLFESARREDNQPPDVDLRPGILVQCSPGQAALTQWEGDFQQGKLESHTCMDGTGQISKITEAKEKSLNTLLSSWNEQEAIFLVYHIDRVQAQRSTLTTWNLTENVEPLP